MLISLMRCRAVYAACYALILRHTLFAMLFATLMPRAHV